MSEETKETSGSDGMSRRGFVATLAAAVAGAVSGWAAPAFARGAERRPARAARSAAAAPHAPHAPHEPAPAALRAEIDKQKKYVDQALKTIRDHELPAGSDPAFVFRAGRPAVGPAAHAGREAARRGEED